MWYVVLLLAVRRFQVPYMIHNFATCGMSFPSATCDMWFCCLRYVVSKCQMWYIMLLLAVGGSKYQIWSVIILLAVRRFYANYNMWYVSALGLSFAKCQKWYVILLLVVRRIKETIIPQLGFVHLTPHWSLILDVITDGVRFRLLHSSCK